MCDFAADAAAAEQLLVGRVLTVKRKTSLVMRISRVSPSGAAVATRRFGGQM